MEKGRSITISSVNATGYARRKCLNLYILVLLLLNGIYFTALAPTVQAFSNNHRSHLSLPSHRLPPVNLLSPSPCTYSSNMINRGTNFLTGRTTFSSYRTTPPQTPTSRMIASDPTNEFEGHRTVGKQSTSPPTHRQKEHHRRRAFLESLTISSLVTTANLLIAPKIALAADATATDAVEMKTFVDPKGLFALNVPKRFFTIRRTVKGDLPNEETGEGRRGSSIFTAGDMSKAEVVAVERFPITALLQTAGVTSTGDLSTFTAIGEPTAIASLIALRRDRDRPGQSKTILVPDSVKISPDEKTLYFQLSTEVDVQKPELLMEQTGVGEIVRVTLAKATLTSGDGQMMAVFASALKQDLAGIDGVALRECVDSFVAVEQKQPTLKK